jgi:hypothetical protein
MPEPDVMPPERGTDAALQQTPPQVPAPQPGGEPPLTPDDLHAFGQLVSLDQDDVRRQTENLDRDEADLEAGRVEPELGRHRVHDDESDLDEIKARHGPWSILATLTGRQAVVVWVGLLLLFFLLLLAVMNGLGQGQNPEPQANAPAGQAPPAGGQAAGGGAAQPGGAAGGGQQPGGGQASGGDAGIVPASCRVPTTGFQVELSDLSWTVELASSPPAGDGDVSAGWDTGVRNLGTEPIAVYRHYSSHATKEGAPNWKPIPPVDEDGTVNNAWDWSWTTAEPGVESTESGYSSFSLLANPPPLCHYRVIDRLVVVYKRPECLDPIIARMKETQSDLTLREAFMNPLAIEGILPAQMANTTCP